MKVEYSPKFEFPVIVHLSGLLHSLSIDNAKELHEELGKVLKDVLPEKHEPVGLGRLKIKSSVL